MSKELQVYTQRELAKMATKLGIKGAHDMRKADVIGEIEKINKAVMRKNKICESDSECAVQDDESKLKYIETVAIGTIVAFKVPDGDGKVKSAKIEKRSVSRRKLQLVTQYGARFVVSFEDVLWVKTGSRWPKGVFELLKGMSKSGKSKEDSSVNRSIPRLFG